MKTAAFQYQQERKTRTSIVRGPGFLFATGETVLHHQAIKNIYGEIREDRSCGYPAECGFLFLSSFGSLGLPHNDFAGAKTQKQTEIKLYSIHHIMPISCWSHAETEGLNSKITTLAYQIKFVIVLRKRIGIFLSSFQRVFLPLLLSCQLKMDVIQTLYSIKS